MHFSRTIGAFLVAAAGTVNALHDPSQQVNVDDIYNMAKGAGPVITGIPVASPLSISPAWTRRPTKWRGPQSHPTHAATAFQPIQPRITGIIESGIIPTTSSSTKKKLYATVESS
jgi:hypothetical protein